VVTSQSGLTLLDIIQIFLKNKNKILIATGIICVTSIILYFFVFDLIYLSSATIKSSGKSSGLLSSIEESLPDIGGLEGLGLSGVKSARELAYYEEIINSRRCLEPLIQKFGLIERDDHKYMEDAIKDFKENKLVIKQERISGTLYIGVYDKDKNLAKEMVEFLLMQLDKINIEMNVLNAKNNREFIERRYYQAKEDLSKAEDSLKSFQLKYGVAPDLQIKAAAQSVFTLESELKAEEVKLDILKKILSSDQSEVKTQEAKINSLKNKITEIQTSTDLSDMLSLGNSPQIAISFLRLQREVEIQTKILIFLLPVYEQAKIEEKRETPTILILDKPVLADRKSKPKRLTMVIVFTFFGFIFSNIYFILRKKWKDYKLSTKNPI
jgi:capsule polysaccharide export protein KpsE/RkpR